MNHRSTTLAVAAIVIAAALTGVAFAVPQQVMAGGHGHGHKHNNHNNGNSIKVDQQINQQNQCNSTSPSDLSSTTKDGGSDGGSDASNSGTLCVNIGANSAEIHK